MTHDLICWRCREGFKNEHNIGSRAYCVNCEDKIKLENKKRLDEYIHLKTEVMFDRALRIIEQQPKLNINDYMEEAGVVLDFALSDSTKFNSSDEMIVAMELLKNRVHMKSEYKILRYRVDFLLPEYKVVLEVDGKLHDFKVNKDSERDIKILNELNKDDEGWEVIRIPTKYVRENVKQLMPAIKGVLKERRKVRKEFGGFLPGNYSKMAFQENKKIAKIAGDRKYYHTSKEKLENELKPKEL